jgi:hypothetical protein
MNNCHFLLKEYLFFGVIFILINPSNMYAQWSADSSVNTAICTAASDQNSPRIVSDGSGGAIIAWFESRSGNYDIYAQRVNAWGVVQWTTDGVAICTAAGDQYTFTIVSDDSGGAIITWDDPRNGNNDIYAQRVNVAGIVQWATDGVAICTAAGDQNSPAIVSDGSGGAIITWNDHRSSGSNDIYAQRVNASGVVQWTTDGVAICTAPADQGSPTIVSDGSGGAIIAFYNYPSSGNFDIYAQRVYASGVVQWTTDGVAICTTTGVQTTPTIVSDDSSGAIIIWYDYRSGSYDIYAQRVNASGAVQWTTDGVAICTAPGDQFTRTIVSDDSGGAIIAWQDPRSGKNDIYAQRVNSSGAVQWTTDGVVICTATNDQYSPAIASDGSGGAIVTWYDYRSVNFDIYAQHVNASGAVLWMTNGTAICKRPGYQYAPAIVSDGSAGAIIAWCDQRNGNFDIYAQHINADAALPIQLAAVTAYEAETGKVQIEWATISEVGNYGFYIERKGDHDASYIVVSPLIPGAGTSLEERHYQWLDDSNLPAGIYYYRLKQADNSGQSTYSAPIKIVVTGVLGVAGEKGIPTRFALESNYPNPFNPLTTISYALPFESKVSLKILNVLGQEVKTLIDKTELAGTRFADWDATNFASGVYFYRLDATAVSDPGKNFSQVRKMVLIK